MVKWVGREESMNDFGPQRRRLFLECVDTAWSTYDAVFRPLIPLATFTCIANVMHDLVAQEIREKVDGLPGIVVRDRGLPVNGRFLVDIDGRYILQVKKLTEDFRTRNIPTETADAFDLQRELPDFPDYPRLTLGYKLDQWRATLTGVYISYNIGDDCQWWQDLRSGESQDGFNLLFPRPDGPSAADQEEADEERKRRENDGDISEDNESA